MKKVAAVFLLAAALMMAANVSRAQLAAPNEAGVSMGHVHLLVRDVDASKKFWTDLGGTVCGKARARTTWIKFPGGVIGLRKGDPTGNGTGGVDHIGFQVKSGAGLMDKFAAMGLKTEPTKGGCSASPVGSCGFMYTTEGVKVEFIEKPSNMVPIEFDHIHFAAVGAAPDGANSASTMREWYQKVFGAADGTSGGRSDGGEGARVTGHEFAVSGRGCGDPRHEGDGDRSHWIRGEGPRGVLQKGGGERHQAGCAVYEEAGVGDHAGVCDRPLGKLH